jgi:aryl-alcohol dehydrogenase (NADP+)
MTNGGHTTRPTLLLDHHGRGLGGGDLAIPIGLGCNTFGRTTDAAGSHRVLDAFAAAGGALVDTADTYSDGVSESVLGDWLRRRRNRDQVLVATKVGNHPRFEGLSPATVTAAAEESLRRLSTDRIDVYFAHYQDDRTPVEESAAAFDALVRCGKVRAVGLSNFSATAVREWLDVAHREGLAAPVALQPHYSLVHRPAFETELADLAAEAGLAVLPYRALGGGFLTGKYRTGADTEDRARGAGVRPLLTREGLSLLDTVHEIAAKHHVAAASVALAWLLHQPTVVAPLASATSPTQLDELLTAPDVRLTPAELGRLAAASDLLP